MIKVMNVTYNYIAYILESGKNILSHGKVRE